MNITPNNTVFIDVGASEEPYSFAPCPGVAATRNTYTCATCDYSSSNVATFKEHTHTKSIKYACKLCKFNCFTKRELDKHERGHKAAGKKFKKQKDSKHNLKIQKMEKYNCKVCSVRCKTPECLSIHSELCKIIDEQFSCALCEWKSRLHSQILLHLIHHPNQSVNDKVIDVSILRKNGIMK